MRDFSIYFDPNNFWVGVLWTAAKLQAGVPDELKKLRGLS